MGKFWKLRRHWTQNDAPRRTWLQQRASTRIFAMEILLVTGEGDDDRESAKGDFFLGFNIKALSRISQIRPNGPELT